MTITNYITEIRGRYAIGDLGELVALFRENKLILKGLVDSIVRQNSYVYLVNATLDGCYCVEDGESWIVYEQERGRVEYGPVKYDDYCTAIAELVQLSGNFG